MRKRILCIIIIIIILFTAESYSQELNNKNKYDIYLDLGLKYTPIEYLSGPLLGISIYSPNRKFGFNIRNDIILHISHNPYISPSRMILSKYYTYNYFDVDYKITSKFTGCIGIGWIYTSFDQNRKFNHRYGYTTASISLKYKITWLTVEIRGDIPVEQYKKKQIVGPEFLFPVSVGFSHKFKPRNIVL